MGVQENENKVRLSVGHGVFTEDGTRLGTIQGFDENGFYVSARDGLEGLSIEHVRSGHSFGEAELTWRCGKCGEVGPLVEELPPGCPACSAPKEELYYGIED